MMSLRELTKGTEQMPEVDMAAILAYFGEGRAITISISPEWAFQSEPSSRQAEFDLPPPISRLPFDDASHPVAYQTDWGNIVKATYRFGGRVIYNRKRAGEWLATLELPPLWG